MNVLRFTPKMSEDNEKDKPFDGEKYSKWNIIRSFIASEDALRVLNEKAPAYPKTDWKKCERIAKAIIVEHLSDTMLSFSTEEDTVKDVMDKLDEIYESLAAQLAIEKKLLRFKYNETTTLSKHFICFDEMMIELNAAGKTLSEMSKIARLLSSLPNSHDALVTAIQTQEENLSLAFVKIKLLDYEIKLLAAEKGETSVKVLGRKECYFLINNNTATENQRMLQTVQMQNEEQRFAVNQNENKTNDLLKTIFLIDSGATDHVAKDIDIFKILATLAKPIKISIAKKGEFISATKIGTIEVKTNLGVKGVLENVLYVPEAPKNILSVRRIQ